MISTIQHSRFAVVAAMSAVALAGCDSIRDVRDEPYTDIPTPTVVLQGDISGLGTRRPIVLQNVLQDGANTKTTQFDFFGTANQAVSPFTFGSIPVGSSYNLTVATQPYGKVCTVTNGSGTASSTLPPISIACVNDTAVTRFAIGGTIAAGVAAIPNAKVLLTTEEGTRELPATGQTTFTFPDAVFDSRTSLPIMTWRITATYTAPDGSVNNCQVANGTNEAGESTVPPSANVTNVAINACTFTVTGNAQYSLPPGGGVAPAMGEDGLVLGLRNIATGAAIPGAPDVTVGAFSTTNVTLWPEMVSNARAVHDVVVVRNPTGQTCIVRVLSGTATYHGSALWLVNPVLTAQFQPTGVAVRCRNTPAVAANSLAGTYMYIQRDPNNADAITNRRYLTLFPEGTFLYANHSSTGGATGVEHGFYNFNAAAGQLSFTVITDTNGGNVTANPPTAYNLSFSGMVGYAGGSITLNNVVKTPAPNSTLTLPFTGLVLAPTPPNPANTFVQTPMTWVMTEPKSLEGQMTGAWISADHRRSWVFNFDDTTGIHFGVNGPVNLQDGCFVFDDGTASSGYYTRRGGSTGCMGAAAGFGTGFATFDTPGVGASTLPPGWLGKFPGSQGAQDGRPPSPNPFTVTPGTGGAPDKLTVQGSVNAVLIGSPQEFFRTRAN